MAAPCSGRPTATATVLCGPARRWQAAPVTVQRTPQRAVRIDPEWIGEPLTLRLVSGQQQIEVRRDAAGRVEVHQP